MATTTKAKSAELKSLLGDPNTGETIINLGDDVNRRMKFDFGAFRILEDVCGMPFTRAVYLPLAARSLVILVYVGCHADALRRKEEWTLDRVTDLIDMRHFPELWARSKWAAATALAPYAEASKKIVGEIKASVH